MARSISNAARVGHLREALAVAKKGDDPEGVHQLRVLCRRLSAWLDLGGRRIGRDDLKWLRDAAGPIRDLDVILTRDVPPPMRAWLHREWKKARPHLVAAIDDPRTEGIVTLFETNGPISHAEAKTGLARMLDKAERAIERVDDEARPIDLHRVRRKLRPIRYALEWLREDASPIEAAQDLLGSLSDAVILHRMTAEWGKDPARERTLSAEMRKLAKEARPSLPQIRSTIAGLR